MLGAVIHRGFHAVARTMVVTLAALATGGCHEPPPQPDGFVVTFEVATDQAPLPDAELLVNGQLVGRSDAAGSARLLLRGREGAVVPVQIRCPAGLRSPAAPFDVTLRAVQAVDRAAAARGVVHQVNCPPEDRTVGVVVRSNTPNVPVVWQNREVSRTDATGVAHLSFRVRPSTQLELALATTATRPTLQPENPSTRWVVPDADDVFVWNVPLQDSARPARPARPVHHRRPPSSTPRVIRLR